MIRPADLLVAFVEALRRTHHRADAARSLPQDRAAGQIRPIRLELPEGRHDPLLEFVEQGVPALRVALADGERQLVEGGPEQHEGDAAGRCLESYVAFHRARPHPRFAPTLAAVTADADWLRCDPIGDFLAALKGRAGQGRGSHPA